jgi:hypothetical protein
VPAAHNFYKDMMLDEIDAEMEATTSATTPAYASASMTASVDIGEYASDDHDEFTCNDIGIANRSDGDRHAGRA